jgi:hypothetical protein
VVTRADELLAEMRRILREPEQQGTALWYAARDLDDFMSSFGLLPKGWQVPIAADVQQGANIEVPPATVARMAEVIEAAVSRMCGMEAHPALPGRMAQVAARAIAEAIVEEHRQAVAMGAYWSIYRDYEMARAMAEPVMVDPMAVVNDRRKAAEQAARKAKAFMCTTEGPHPMHYVGSTPLVCHGKNHGPEV